MSLPVIAPHFKDGGIPIIFACDNNYALFVCVAIRNIVALASEENRYDILVLELGLDEKRRQGILGTVAGHPHISVRFFNLTEYIRRYDLDAIHVDKRFTKEVFFPVFIPDLCREYDKVLSLDPDILIRRDVAELYRTELGNNLVGAVVDFESCSDVWTGDPSQLRWRRYIEEDFGIPVTNFFNSGVVLFNIRQIRAESGFQNFSNALGRVVRLPDQDILNVVCKNRVLYLDPAWNVQAFAYTRENFKRLPADKKSFFEDARQRAALIHYTFIIKPWFHPDCTGWWALARQTPFYEEIVSDFLLNPQRNPIKIHNPTRTGIRASRVVRFPS